MVVNIILCGVIVAQAILHYIERGKLQDRIMSRSLNEYKQADKPPVQHKTAHDRVLERWKEV